MMSQHCLLLVLAVAGITFSQSHGHGPRRGPPINYAKVARQLVHNATWASVGTISVDGKIKDYPMVSVLSVDDSDENGASTGKIHFLLTDMDYPGKDWRVNNKLTFLFSDEQTLTCQKLSRDPMEPTCGRVMISGQLKMMEVDTAEYNKAWIAFKTRHPASVHWIDAHHFYLNQLEIQHIYIFAMYGGPKEVTPADYYAETL